jgi:endonuclease III
MLRDNVGESRLLRLGRVPIPVDVHVARATFALGAVHGRYAGPLDQAYEAVRQAWFAGAKGLSAHGRSMIALDVDEPLWHLSRLGCKNRDKATGQCPVAGRCEAKALCVRGRVIVDAKHVEIDT